MRGKGFRMGDELLGKREETKCDGGGGGNREIANFYYI